MVKPIANGKLYLGFFASPPAWAILSNPIKLANNKAEADKNVGK
jgi:hypothetical protein